MKNSRPRVLSLFVKSSIVSAFSALAVLTALGKGPVAEKAVGILISFGICTAYIYFSPRTKDSAFVGQRKLFPQDETVEANQFNVPVTLEVKDWILDQISRISSITDEESRIRSCEMAASRSAVLFPYGQVEFNDSDTLLELLCEGNDYLISISDEQLVTLRRFSRLYRPGVITIGANSIRFSVISYLQFGLVIQ